MCEGDFQASVDEVLSGFPLTGALAHYPSLSSSASLVTTDGSPLPLHLCCAVPAIGARRAPCVILSSRGDGGTAGELGGGPIASSSLRALLLGELAAFSADLRASRSSYCMTPLSKKVEGS